MAVSDRVRLHRLVDELPEPSVAPAEDAPSRPGSPQEAEDWRLAQHVGPDLDAADQEIAAGTARAIPWADRQHSTRRSLEWPSTRSCRLSRYRPN